MSGLSTAAGGELLEGLNRIEAASNGPVQELTDIDATITDFTLVNEDVRRAKFRGEFALSQRRVFPQTTQQRGQ